ncbi:MAG TPA: nitroreductase family protein [Tepidisphaeraceae bacterium]|nr:nitroreductase family protein [Tepidisphaeraceae bacterium]
MDALAAIAARHSTREFTDKSIPKPTLEQIIDAGRLAPTARNEQPWEFVVVTDRTLLQRVANATDYGRFIATAAACVVVLCKDTKYYLEDGCAATENILIAATALGVQSCWIAGDKKPYGATIADILGIPPTHKLISLLALGYENAPAHRKVRRPLTQVLHWDRY